MSDLDEFVGRLRGLVISVADMLATEEAGLIMHLIDHDEGGEAMLALAWIVVENGRVLPRDAIDAVVQFAADLGVAADLPEAFGQTEAAE